jgi:hypothetical protein
MENKIKNIWYIVLILGVLTLSYGIISYVNTYSRSIEPGAYKSFSVSAEGKAVSKPDVAKFSFSIITEGKDLAKIQKENTDKANAAIDFLKKQGVDSLDIKTTNYNISPKYTYYNCSEPVPVVLETQQGGLGATKSKPCPPPEITGYTLTQTINVKIKDFSKIGDILSGIVEYGVNNVSDLTFTIDNPDKVQNEARTEAILKAKEKAQRIAQAAGFKLGNLLSIEEGYSPYYVNYGMGGQESLSLKASPAPASPTIEPGSEETKVTVTLRYEIK